MDTNRRQDWIQEILNLSGSFGDDASYVAEKLFDEIEVDGSVALLDHLRLCGGMPEQYRYDSSEEKLYAKYTDAVLSATFDYLGLNSFVLTERADAADVQARALDYDLVADAKAFRLSRTAIKTIDGMQHRGLLDE